MNIEIDDQTGQVRVCDDRLFLPERRAYARRLLDALFDHPAVRKAEVDIRSSTCRVDFDPGSNAPNLMARVFVDAVRAATASSGRPKASWRLRKPNWSTLTASRSGGGEVSLRETHEVRPGRFRFLDRGPWRNRPLSVVGVTGDDPEDRKDGEPQGLATGWKRWGYLAMGGGAFALTLVGLVVPGVPTVPFLLATSYFLVRSSPWLDEKLRRTAFLGPILREWEDHSALSRTSKVKLIGLSATIVLVTIALLPIGPVVLIVILVLSSISVYGIARMPALAKSEQAESSQGRRISLALPVG